MVESAPGEATRGGGAGAAPGRQGAPLPDHPGAGGDLPPTRAAWPTTTDRLGEGTVARTDLGQKLLVLRPTLADWVVKMPRGAQVIYPKTLALMVMAADVRAGMTVVEAGAGSGALSIALLQALAPGERLHSFERRPRLRRPGPAQRGALVRQGPRRLRAALRRRRRGHRRGRARGPGPARPAGAVAGRAGRGRGPAPGRGAGLLRGHRAPGHAPGRGAGVLGPLRPGRDLGGHLPPLARRRPGRPPPAPHDRPHRLLVSARRVDGPGRPGRIT